MQLNMVDRQRFDQAYATLTAALLCAAEALALARSAAGLNATLRARWDEALLYRRLATLRLDAPLPQTDPEELLWRGARRDAFAALCEELGARGLAQRPQLWQD